MGAQKKVRARVSGDGEELARPLQAIVMADTFASKFRPVTLERPKVLLPLVNIPVINYTLAWLESADVGEIFVFCCAHSSQVIDYLESAGWFSRPNFSVSAIKSHNSFSVGDALRIIYERNVIHGDFVLVSGDTVTNMSLMQAVQEHKERRKKDANAIMTMVIKPSKPSQITRQSRLGSDELFMAINPDTKQLLYYEDKAGSGVLSLDKALLTDNAAISLHNDKEDCYIDICSLEVLSLFADNFDYQHLRHHFVNGLLVDDIMGYKIFTHEIDSSSYAAKVDNFRSYDAISKDIIQRWTYPYVPDVRFCGNPATKLERQGTYRATEIALSQSVQIGPFSLIGHGTKIGSNSKIWNSVIGEGCNISSNVSIEGSYIWNNVTIEDGCELKHAVVCDGVVIKSGAVLEPGVVLSFKVVVGPKFVVPAYSKVSLLPQPTEHDSDEELEYANNSSGAVELSCTVDKLNREIASELSETQGGPSSELGIGGVGYNWSAYKGGHEEELRHSVAPIPADELLKLIQDIDDDDDTEELESDSNTIVSENDVNGYFEDNYTYFEREVEETFLRAVSENLKVDDALLELKSLRLSYNIASMHCAGALFYSMMKLALQYPHSSDSELCGNSANVIKAWPELLKSFIRDEDDGVELILKFEELCLESTTELFPLFGPILRLLYDNGIIGQDAISQWAEEKKGANESDRVFVKQSAEFFEWLREA